jgi:hypothetical protein
MKHGVAQITGLRSPLLADDGKRQFASHGLNALLTDTGSRGSLLKRPGFDISNAIHRDTSITYNSNEQKVINDNRAVDEDDTASRYSVNPYIMVTESGFKTETDIDISKSVDLRDKKKLFLNSKSILRKQVQSHSYRDKHQHVIPYNLIQTDKSTPIKTTSDAGHLSFECSPAYRALIKPVNTKFAMIIETGQRIPTPTTPIMSQNASTKITNQDHAIRTINLQKLVSNIDLLRVPSRVSRYQSEYVMRPQIISSRAMPQSKTPGKSPLVSKAQRNRSTARTQSYRTDGQTEIFRTWASNNEYIQNTRNTFTF